MVLDIKLTPDGKHALVASSGFNDHDLIVVDLASKQVVDKETVRQSWFGLAMDPEAGKVWWSGGGGDRIHAFDLKGHELTRDQSLGHARRAPPKNELPKDANQGKVDVNVKPEAPMPRPDPNKFKAGLAFDPASRTLYSLDIDAGTITAIDTTGKKPDRTAKVGERPYDVAIARNGKMLYVSDWIGRAVLAVSPEDLRVVASIGVGEHPNQIAVHPRRRPDLRRLRLEQLRLGHRHRPGGRHRDDHDQPVPQGPRGSTPAALAVSPDGETLYVANADNNCVAVVDVEAPNRSQVKGFIPTGWYPTAVAVTPDSKTLLVGVGKGNQTKANPFSERAGRADRQGQAGRDPRGLEALGRQVSLYRHHALGRPLDRPRPRREGPGRLHRDRLQELPLLRQAPDRRPLSHQDGHPDQGRRPVADQACHLHHQGEPDLRPGLRRPPRGQRRPEP